MKHKLGKKGLSCLLSAAMLVTSLPLTGFGGMTAQAAQPAGSAAPANAPANRVYTDGTYTLTDETIQGEPGQSGILIDGNVTLIIEGTVNATGGAGGGGPFYERERVNLWMGMNPKMENLGDIAELLFVFTAYMFFLPEGYQYMTAYGGAGGNGGGGGHGYQIGGGGAQALGGFNGSGFMSQYTCFAEINYSPSGGEPGQNAPANDGGQTNYNGKEATPGGGRYNGMGGRPGRGDNTTKKAAAGWSGSTPKERIPAGTITVNAGAVFAQAAQKEIAGSSGEAQNIGSGGGWPYVGEAGGTFIIRGGTVPDSGNQLPATNGSQIRATVASLKNERQMYSTGVKKL